MKDKKDKKVKKVKKAKKERKSNPQVRKTLIYAVTAVICVFLVMNSINTGISNYADVKIELANNAAMDTAMNSEVGLDAGGSTELPTVVLPGTTSEGGSSEGGSSEGGETEGGTTEGGESAPAAPVKPEDGVNTLAYYNAVIDKAVSAKVGYNKSRVTDNANMEGSAGLEAMKSLVYQFMGIGEENKYTETVEKGKWGDVAYLTNSKLTASDVTAATCVEEDGKYVITLNLKSGSSAANQSSNGHQANTALDKCGICVGSEDKGYYDHKTGSVIYDAIGGTFASADIKESYSNAVVTATVDPSTGNLISLVVEWNQSVTLSKLMGMSADATGVSHVTYNNFKY